MRYIEENGGRLENIREMAADLRSQGFTDNEINSAYLWVLDQYRQPGFVVRNNKKKMSSKYRRILSDYERHYFTTDGYGSLIQMRQLSIIDDTQLEMIIERAIYSGHEQLDAHSVRTLAWSFLVNNFPGDQSNFGGLDRDENTQIH
jgi:uncharacterized protein Smg (DUF494 family)